MKQISNIMKGQIAIAFLLVNAVFASPRLDVKTISNLPEDKIDIGIASIVLAKEVFPEVDIQEYSAKIDTIVFGVRMLTRGNTNPDYRIRALNTYLYKNWGMEYDTKDPYVKNIRNRYITGLLDTKKGSCVSMPLLYLAVSQRLGYPIYPVCAPQHIFLRYVDPTLKMQNIEATGGGGYSSDDEYIASLQISFLALAKGTYLRTLSYREYLALLIEQNGIYWGQHGNYSRAIEYIELAVKLNPRSADTIRSLGVAYQIQSRLSKNHQAMQEYLTKARECFSKAEQLGVTNIALDNYIEVQQKAQKKFRNQSKPGD